jgi:hypothetical protein
MHLSQRQGRINEGESPHLAAAGLAVFDTVGNPLTTSFNSGVSIEAVRRRLGHASTETCPLTPCDVYPSQRQDASQSGHAKYLATSAMFPWQVANYLGNRQVAVLSHRT